MHDMCGFQNVTCLQHCMHEVFTPYQSIVVVFHCPHAHMQSSSKLQILTFARLRRSCLQRIYWF